MSFKLWFKKKIKILNFKFNHFHLSCLLRFFVLVNNWAWKIWRNRIECISLEEAWSSRYLTVYYCLSFPLAWIFLLFAHAEQQKALMRKATRPERGHRPCIMPGTYSFVTRKDGTYKPAAAESLQSCPTLCDPTDGSLPGSPSLGFSRQGYWSGVPLPSPMNESEKWKWSNSVVSDS